MYEVKENCTVSIKRHSLRAEIYDGTCLCTVINTICLQHNRHSYHISNSTLVAITRNKTVDTKNPLYS